MDKKSIENGLEGQKFLVAKGICLCNLFRSTQPNDRETVIEG